MDKMCKVIEEHIDKDDLRMLWRKFRFDSEDIYGLEVDYKGKHMLKQRAAATMALWWVEIFCYKESEIVDSLALDVEAGSVQIDMEWEADYYAQI